MHDICISNALDTLVDIFKTYLNDYNLTIVGNDKKFISEKFLSIAIVSVDSGVRKSIQSFEFSRQRLMTFGFWKFFVVLGSLYKFGI